MEPTIDQEPEQQDRNTTGLYSDGRLAPYELVRADRTQLLSKMTFSTTYTHATTKEDLCVQFVENFRAQFVHLFPSRAPLLLTPLNECVRQKFISTYIRPTLLPFPELYDAETCARFIANYIAYEPLEDPEALPQRLNSPTTVLLWQVGNAVEMSILLSSLLIGAGYNAYVVVGYASRAVVENDQTPTAWHEALPTEANSDDDDTEPPVRETVFTQFLKKRPALKSTFDATAADRKLQAAARRASKHYEEEARQAEAEADAAEAAAKAAAPRLCHAWVVLLPKGRGIEKPTFIEPSTGLFIDATDERYFGVESVFNHHNYFVNMRTGAGESEALADVDFDLHDLTTWEHVFLSDPSLIDDDAAADDAALGGTRSAAATAAAEEGTSDLGAHGDFALDLPASWVEPLTLSRAQYENRYPGRQKTVEYSDATVTHFAEHSDPHLRVLEVRVQDDVSVHHDQVHTLFKNRKDHLRRRVEYPNIDRSQAPRKTHEWFLPGRRKEGKVEGMREMIKEPGVRRRMRFYWKAREDGLASREEVFFSDKESVPQKITEFYKGREGEDRLLYRSATFDQPKEGGTGMGLSHVIDAARHEETARLPRKMAEKFARNPKAEATEDVRKRVFMRPLASDGEIWVKYHYPTDCITHPFRLFPKNADKDALGSLGAAATTTNNEATAQPMAVVMHYEERPKDVTLRLQLRELVAAEKECLNEIRAKREECNDILKLRDEEEAKIGAFVSAYDVLRNRPRETEAERDAKRAEELRRAESRKDRLAPYIANLDITKGDAAADAPLRLSPENAKLVRDSALKDLKERLIQRGHIMQARMDREKEELNRRQLAYQKNLDSTENAKDSEEFTKFLQQATWRMKILDDRLTRHIEQASEKYAQLAKELAEDSRLAAIYETPN